MNFNGMSHFICALVVFVICIYSSQNRFASGALIHTQVSSIRERRDTNENTVVIEENEPPPVETSELHKIGDYKICGINGKKIAEIEMARAASPRDWTWLAGILRKSDYYHFCGGAVITTKHILTAAHCLPEVSADKILIRLGEYDFTRRNDSNHKDFEVKSIHSHEDYDTSTYENDIAIILLKGEIVYSVYIQPLCLPPPGGDYDDMTCIVAGWGTLSYGGPKSDVLMEVPVPVWKLDQCRSSYTHIIFDTNICAAGYDGGKDSCQGDSGGPLMCQLKEEEKKWSTIGIVSWGIKCGLKNKPGIYTRVEKYLGWIRNQLLIN